VSARPQRGQASVELALVLPLLLGLLVTVAQVTLVVIDNILAVNAAREAVRAAVVVHGDPLPAARNAALAAGPLDPARLELVIDGDGGTITAHIVYRIAVITPFWGHFVSHPAVVVDARMARED
jgi:hypothetical protein